jgi:hypothetical protein
MRISDCGMKKRGFEDFNLKAAFFLAPESATEVRIQQSPYLSPVSVGSFALFHSFQPPSNAATFV